MFNWVNKIFNWKNQGEAPSETLQNEGFKVGQKMPATIFNNFFAKVSSAITEIQTNVDTIDDKKVDKIDGKGLSTNDFDTTYKTRLDTITPEKIAAWDKAAVGEIPQAGPDLIGGVKIGYEENGKNYPVELSDGKMFVNVPWTDENDIYTHPAHTARTSGLYKITVDSQGHVTEVVAVAKGDITGLGIPAQDTTYNNASANAAGLMSAAHFTKVENIETGANKTTVDSAISITSTNPIQNKVIVDYVNSNTGFCATEADM